jgi:cytochrome c-type biogenesis protein CcmH/NrfF
VLARVSSTLPLITISLCAFNIAVVVQEFARGVAARQRRGGETVLASLYNLVAKSRRRYGGYVVHVGIVVMFLGFTGKAWGVDKELSMSPGEKVQIEEYELTYLGTRMEVDTEKRMVITDLEVKRHGELVGVIHPSKFIYKASPEAPSTEVAKHITLRNDLYVIVGMVSPATKVAAFQIHVNPLVSWIWFGVGILIFGALISMWPDVSLQEAGAFGYVRAAASVATAVMFAVILAWAPSMAYGQQPTHSEAPGTIEVRSDQERELFRSLNCICPTCPHKPNLMDCACPTAMGHRSTLRAELAKGLSIEQVRAIYVGKYGQEALSVPPSEGAMRGVWALPLLGIAAGAGGVVFALRRWRRHEKDRTAGAKPLPAKAKRDDYDDKLDQELRALDAED